MENKQQQRGCRWLAVKCERPGTKGIMTGEGDLVNLSSMYNPREQRKSDDDFCLRCLSIL